jgi:predicted thioesterase
MVPLPETGRADRRDVGNPACPMVHRYLDRTRKTVVAATATAHSTATSIADRVMGH